MSTRRSPSSWPRWSQYAFALGLMGLALTIRAWLDPVLGDTVPFVTVFAALLLLLLAVHPGPFLAAAILGGVGSLVMFVQPRLTLDTAGHMAIMQAVLFGIASGAAVIAAWISHQLESARRRENEDQTRRSERLRLITDAIPALVSYVDNDCRYRFVNGQYGEWFGRSADEILGQRVRDVLGPEEYTLAEPHIGAALSGRRSRFESAAILYADGHTRHIVSEYVPDLRDNGTVAGFYALVTDVTEKREAEAAQARLAAIVETSGDAIMSISLAGEIVSWNAGAERLFGYSAEEAIGHTIELILPAARAAAERSIVEPARQGELVGPYDTVRRAKDGRLIDVSVTVSPIRDPSGRVIGVSKVDRDITERKQAERALRESERRLATLVSNLPGVAYRCGSGPDRPMQFISDGARDIVGYEPQEFLSGRVSWTSRIHPEDVDRVWSEIEDAIRERRSFRISYRMVHRDGSQRWVWEQGEPVFGIDDDALTIEGLVTDVTQQKHAEQQLEATRARERACLEHLPVGVWFADERGQLTYGNEAARRIWGGMKLVGPEQLALYEAYWHGTEHRIGAHDWALARAIDHGETSINEEVDIRGFDGHSRTILNSAVPVRDADDRIIGAVVMNLDISEQKQAAEALAEADRRKDEFLATLGHELRNPLAAIRSAVELLVETPPAEREPLDRVTGVVHRQVLLMIRLIDDLLDVSRITHGTLDLQTQRTTVLALVEQAIDAARPAIDCKDQTLQLHAPDDAIEIEGDAVRLIQGFTNILSNACKYTDPGGHIDITVARDGDDAVIEIRDDGIGIPADQLDGIFEMFSQLESPGRGKIGLGIGLALTRRLVEMHGGSVIATSEGPGRGSTFAVRLPAVAASALAVPESVSSPPASSTAGAGRRVLVVDDNVDAADCLASLLSTRGHETRMAYDGTSALSEADAFRPEVILLDLGLPDIDGIDVCKTLRSEPWAKNVLVIALSGWGQDADRRRTSEAGFDAHLTKPADFAEVTRLLAG